MLSSPLQEPSTEIVLLHFQLSLHGACPGRQLLTNLNIEQLLIEQSKEKLVRATCGHPRETGRMRMRMRMRGLGSRTGASTGSAPEIAGRSGQPSTHCTRLGSEVGRTHTHAHKHMHTNTCTQKLEGTPKTSQVSRPEQPPLCRNAASSTQEDRPHTTPTPTITQAQTQTHKRARTHANTGTC